MGSKRSVYFKAVLRYSGGILLLWKLTEFLKTLSKTMNNDRGPLKL